MFVLSVDSLCLSALIMSHLVMTKTKTPCFYFCTLARISIRALSAPLSLSLCGVRMSNDTFDIRGKLSVVKSSGFILHVSV